MYLTDKPTTWHALAVCFGIFHGDKDNVVMKLRGRYNGTIRSALDAAVMMI